MDQDMNQNMDQNEEFDAIMREIIDGLTGNPLRDIAYLRRKTREYSNHKLGGAISSACSQLALSCAPKEVRDMMRSRSEKRFNDIGTDLKKAHFFMCHGELSEALDLVEDVEKRIDPSKYQDSEFTEYRWFSDPFEESLYRRIYKPTAEITDIGMHLPWAYRIRGLVLKKQGDLEKVRETLKKALHYKPIDFTLNADYIDTFREESDFDAYFKMTVDLFKIAYLPEQMARAYRNLGFYFWVKELYDEANVCFWLSLRYDATEEAQSALFELEHENGVAFEEPSDERIAEIAARYEFPIEPDADILDLANRSARFFLERRQYEETLYFLRIDFGLTGSDETKARIDEIEAKLPDKAEERAPDREEEEEEE